MNVLIRTTNLALLVSLLGTCTNAVSQQAAAGVLILDLRYELLDLDLFDGITPALTYAAPGVVLRVREYPLFLSDPPVRDRTYTDWGINEIYGDNGAAYAGANDYAQRSSASASYAAYSAQTMVTRLFELTPRTRVLFTVEAEWNVRASGDDGLALARLDGQLFGAAGLPLEFGAERIQSGTGSGKAWLLAGGYSGDDPLSGSVALHTYAHAVGLPIPEPASWLAMLGGLAMLCSMHIRRHWRAATKSQLSHCHSGCTCRPEPCH